ncbi:hypothetical protein [Streptomyces sp. BA2]|uniref:hypothetical protein n=1 Tax=Streptomyces sp. BA2 TaxID=436595 RepID=UPI001F1E5DE6|nr:hypothetical protein [Streptomyces sp. BA2]
MNGHRTAAVALAVGATLLITLQAAPPTWADRTGGGSGGKVKGGANGRVITAETRVRTSVVGGGAGHASETGSPSPVGVAWTPPACWYEPAFSPKEIQSTVKAWRAFGASAPLVGGIGHVISDAMEHRYKDGHPYKNYNLSKQGEGMFWASVINPNREDDPEATSCDRQPFWVDEGQTPAEPMAASPEILAQYAYDELPVPGTEIKMAPRGTSTVNLPTWVWLDKGRFKKVSVTASLPGTGLSATTTAEPESLRIEPGTADAEVYPASGSCSLAKRGGGIGEPYARGKANRVPPCGVTYMRSPGANATYALRGTLTWKISWSSSTGEGGTLPPGSFGATQRIPVQEIQSVNR